MSHSAFGYPFRVTFFAPTHDEPSPLEKTNQLERILLSNVFRRQAKTANLLRRLVENAIAGIESTEHQLGVELFGRGKDWETAIDNIVRQNMTRLRGLLAEYYASEGMEDRLNLELPGYQTVFSYNPRDPVERSFRQALKHIATDPRAAFSHLDQVLSLEPDNAEALAARGEAELWRPMIGNEVALPDLLEAAAAQAKQALRYDGNCWRAHIVMGAVHVCSRDWKKAEKHFDAAIASSPERAKFHPWYAGFLLAAGRPDEALALTRAAASGPSVSPWPQLTYAIFLYAARRFEEAKRVIMQAKNEYPDVWLSHVLWSCVSIASERRRTPVPLFGMSMIQALPDGTPVYTALSLYEHILRLAPEGPESEALRGLLGAWISEKESALARPSDDDEPPSFTEVRVSPFHLAIGYLALEEYGKAIELLALDMERGHPLMVWLHLWPLFDPLRELPEFKHLLAPMRLP